MRIIAGTYKGRHIVAPRGRRTRPTADKVREAVFSILGDLEGLRFLDLYAGTGAMGFEAASRGASGITAVERDRIAVRQIVANRDALGVDPSRFGVVCASAERATNDLVAEGRQYDIIFSDPPWNDAAAAHGELQGKLHRLLAPGGRAVLEHGFRLVLGPPPVGVCLLSTRRYGECALSFYALRTT